MIGAGTHAGLPPYDRSGAGRVLSNAFVCFFVLTSVATAATITVNDASNTVHDCSTTGTGTCTLVDAITFANSNPGHDDIYFSIPGSGVHTISGDPPSVTGPTTIDGYTQPGANPNTNGPGLGDNAVLLIEIVGCIDLQGGHNTIRGLVINGCGSSAVHLGPPYSVSEDVIEGNFIGTDPTGMIPRPNGSGVYSENCGGTVGGVTPAARNIISGNGGTGIVAANDMRIHGNFIGTNAAGTGPIPNDIGIDVQDPSFGCLQRGTEIGATSSGARNIISGNRLGVSTGQVSPVSIQGNYVGTDVTGTQALPNEIGLHMVGGNVGGTNPGAGNVISGNIGGGVVATNDTVGSIQGNLIGTDVTGVLPLGNGAQGVLVNVVNLVNTISGNTIAFNGAADPVGGGIVVIGNNPDFDSSSILRNSIFANTSDGSVPGRGLGIDLEGDGVTENEECDVDQLQNFPVLTSAVAEPSSIRIQGTLNSVPSETYRIELFANPTCAPSGYGQGKTFIGFIEVATNGSCGATIDVTLPVACLAGQYITATATGPMTDPPFDPPGFNTSEFSACVLAVPTPGLQVLAIGPHSGPASGGTAVVVSGTGFQNGATLLIGGVAATGVNVVGSTEIDASTPGLPAGSLNDVTVTNPTAFPVSPRVLNATLPNGWLADFLDVPQGDNFHDFVETIFRNGITAGCGGGLYCRDNPVTRAQMAVFLLKAKFGPSYVPPAATGTVFNDVYPGDFAADWIEELANLQITAGCGGGNYCPNNPVTRAQMAVLLLRTDHGLAYTPPPCTGVFDDVECLPTPSFAVDWIEQLYNEGITGGCGLNPLIYCPASAATRGQMAVFLVRTFNLQ